MRAHERFRHGVVDLVPLSKNYLRTTLCWRNANDVRVWFKTKDIIRWDDHLKWYENYCQVPTDQVFLAEHVENGELIGQVSVYNIDYPARRAEIGRFIAAPGARGRGLMRLSCIALLEYCRANLNLSYLYLEVLSSNNRGVGLYKSLGFEATTESDGVINMGLHIGERHA